jgi:hypothetical protein
MQNIGWFEYAEEEERTEKVKTLISEHNSSNTSGSDEPIAKQEAAKNEGGVIVAEENKTEETEATSTEVDETQVEETVVEEKPEEEVVDNSEVVAEEPDFAKMFGDLQTAIESGLEKNAKAADAAIEKAATAFENKVGELVKKHDELVSNFESLKDNIGGVEKRLQSVEDETAIKKSGDLGGSKEDTVQKSAESKWGGSFLGLSDLR